MLPSSTYGLFLRDMRAHSCKTKIVWKMGSTRGQVPTSRGRWASRGRGSGPKVDLVTRGFKMAPGARRRVDLVTSARESCIILFCRHRLLERREERMATTAIDGISGLSVLEENELLTEVCVVMDAIGFPLSTGFTIRELGFCSVIAMRNASIGYYPSTGYAWMLDEDRKTVNQYIHNEHY